MTDRDLRSTAFHEAGHAVVARRLGLGVRTVSIIETADGLGHTLHTGQPPSDEELYNPDARTRSRLEKLIIATWAGPLAEERATGTWNDTGAGLSAPIEHPEHGPVLFTVEGSDIRRVIQMVEVVQGGPGRTTDAYVEYLRLRALDLIEQGSFIWDQVEAVAGALVEHQTLTARRLRDVCQRPIDDAIPPREER